MTYVSLDEYKRGGIYGGVGGIPRVMPDTKFTRLDNPIRDSENIYNSVTVRYYPREVGSSAVRLFQTQQRVFIKAGETKVIEAQYRDPDAKDERISGSNMEYPAANSEWTFRSKKAPAGLGANLNAQMSVSAEFFANVATIQARNAGPLPGWLFVGLDGIPIRIQDPVEVTEIDPDSITAHGFRQYPDVYDAPYIGNEQDARALAKVLVAAWSEPRTFLPPVKFDLYSGEVSAAAAFVGPTRKIAIQETVSGLLAPDYWTLGEGELDDTAGADNTNLYGLDVYSIQRVRLKIGSLSHADCELTLIPEDLAVRPRSWIDPPVTFFDGEIPTKNLFDLFLRDDVNAIWHDKKLQSADVSKTSSTAFSDLTGLSFPIKAGETWQFLSVHLIDSNSTAHAKLTAVLKNANNVEINADAFGRLGLWGAGSPVSSGNTPTFGGTLNITVPGTDGISVLLSGRVTSTVDGTVQIQGAQQVSNGSATVFRENSFLIAFLVGGREAA